MTSAWQIEPYRPEMAAAWDAVTDTAPGGTVMQSRRFLDYHGTRFRDLSLVGHRGGAIEAVLPIAASAREPGLAVSHPGTSFGGLISTARDPAHARAFLRQAAVRLLAQGFTDLLWRPPPSAVLRQPDDRLLPDLMRLGRLTQMDLCAVLTLPGPEQAYWRSEIRRGERKGLAAHPVESPEAWAELHALLSARLSGKYGKTLVHSVPELVDLHARLGPQSRAQIIRDAGGTALSGQWFIDYGTGTLHNQYNGASDAGLALGASSYGISLALEAAAAQGFRTFSFGRSTNEDGWTENRALQRFKQGFGAGLCAQAHLMLPLDALTQLRE
jgi:hypothetical protein